MNLHTSVSPLDVPVHVTSWEGPFAKKPTAAKPIAIRKLAQRIRTRHAASKDELFLLKLSAFGDIPTDKGYLRNEANLLAMHGVELDYDDESIGIDEAVEILTKANIAAIVYTSPSHTPEAPRWRILLPLSEPHDQDQRGLLLGRVAGAFKAACGSNPFAAESWTPAQCYYYGFIDGCEANHVVVEVDGECIDRLYELDNQHWCGKPNTITRKDASGRPVIGDQGSPDWNEVDATIAEFRHGIHPALLSLAGKLVGEGWSWDDIHDELMRRLQESAGASPQHPRHKRWKGVSADRRKEVSGLISDCFRKHKSNHRLLSTASDLDTPGSGSTREPEDEPSSRQEQAKPDEHDEDEDVAPAQDESPKATRPKPKAWKQLLQKSKTGFLPNEFNVVTVLTHAASMAGALAYDRFRSRYVLTRAPPWDAPGEAYPRQWADTDDTQCAMWLQGEGLQVRPKVIPGAMMVAASRQAFNPLQDWLTSLTWDRKPRVDTWLTNFLGAENTPAHREFGRRFLLSGVARAMRPGCKVDTMMVLEGPQGSLKSTALRTLAGAEYFTDELHDFGSKDAAMQATGVWIIELSELDNMSRAEITRTKAWLSRTVDRYRPPYGRALVDQPRQCVIAGSTNADDYLRDATGGRRFWPVKVGTIDIDGLAEVREQLWAEALDRWRDGEPWWIKDRHMLKAAEDAQDERLQEDEGWREVILEYLVRQKPLEITAKDILKDVLGLEMIHLNRRNEMVVGNLMRRLGWKKSQKGLVNDRRRYWRPPE